MLPCPKKNIKKTTLWCVHGNVVKVKNEEGSKNEEGLEKGSRKRRVSKNCQSPQRKILHFQQNTNT